MDTSPNQRVCMWREDLDKAPRFALPGPYRLRPYRPGNAEDWLRIHKLADPVTTITPDLFAAQFGDAEDSLGQRQLYAVDRKGNPVGTVTAWEGSLSGRRMGRVHWLAVIPEHAGRGLGRALLSAACRRLADLNFQEAFLVTGSRRLPAIRLYFQFGFMPAIENETEAAAWVAISEELCHRRRSRRSSVD